MATFVEQYTRDDHADLGPGPWADEPDKAVWVDEASDLDCMIVRNRMGALCGYVGLPPGHPWHGKDYDDVDVEVHGGLTFANRCTPEGEGKDDTICHLPQPGRPDDVWWLGFDTCHLYDLAPRDRSYAYNDGVDVYRDLDYVMAEVADLARQCAEAAA